MDNLERFSNLQELLEIIQHHFINPHQGYYLYTGNKILIFRGNQDCVKNLDNIINDYDCECGVWPDANCGTLIAFPNDITITLFTQQGNIINSIFYSLEQYLYQNYNILIKQDNNDLLAYSPEQDIWFKIASSISTTFNNYVYACIHISIDMNEILLNEACTKNREKQPGGLNPLFGINKEEILSLIIPLL